MTTKTPTRGTRYVVRPKPQPVELGIKPRIVMAVSRAAALAHVAGTLIEAAPATMDEIEELASQGIRTEYPQQAEAQPPQQ